MVSRKVLRAKTKRKHRQHSKYRKHPTHTRKVGGQKSEHLPPLNELQIEILYNDFLRQNTESNKNILEQLRKFTEQTPQFRGIPVLMNDRIHYKDLENYLPIDPNSTNTDIALCYNPNSKNEITIETFEETFRNPYGNNILIALKYDAHIIGLLSLTILHKTSMININTKEENNSSKNTYKSDKSDKLIYIYINWLCGSKYKGVGSLLINLVKEMKSHFDAEAIELLSLTSSKDFYEKMGFTFKGKTKYKALQYVYE